MVAVKPLPVLAPACSLSEAEVHQQLARYRAAGEGALLLECAPGRRAVRIASHVPDSLLGELIDTERACCPFFSLTWDPDERRLAVSVSDAGQEPALDAICDALGISRVS